MKIAIRIFAAFLAIIAIGTTQAQILELENALFKTSSDSIELFKLLDCRIQEIDSSKKILKDLPETGLVQEILKGIAYSQDTDYFEPVYEIYKRQMDIHRQRWGSESPINYYFCDIVNRQFDILVAFEQTLKSLKLAKDQMNSQELFSYYFNNKMRDRALIYLKLDRDSIINKYHVFLEDFRRLNRVAWFAGQCSFNYMDPYRDSIKTGFVGQLLKCNWDDNMPESCYCVWSNMNLISYYEDDTILNYLMKNFDHWAINNRHVVQYVIGQKSKNTEYLRFLLKKVTDKNRQYEQDYEREYHFKLVAMSDEYHQEIAYELLLEIALVNARNGNFIPLKYLYKFRNKKVLKLYRKVRRKGYLSEGELGFYNNQIERMKKSAR